MWSRLLFKLLKDKKIDYKGLEPAKNLSYYCRRYLNLNVPLHHLRKRKIIVII